jgi:CRP-like cAMP-binding protein/RsiW-degrading membrane proteinase PrsW (M82 family)
MGNIPDVLRNHTLLHGVPEHELAAAASTMQMVSYADRTTILKEGEVGDDCFFVLSGEVSVTARGLIGSSVRLATLGPGALIGEIALLTSERRTATIRAVGEVRALRLDREAFRTLAALSPLFHESLTYSARIREIHGLLSKASIWSSIPDPELRGLAEVTVLRSVKQGQVIVYEGDASNMFCTIGSGSFEVRSSGKRVAVLHQGDYFGEIALLTGVSTTATITALEDGKLLALGEEEFRFTLMRHEPVKRQFLAALRIRRPDIADIAIRQWMPDSEQPGQVASTGQKWLGPPAQQRWIDVLMGMGGLFLVATLMSVWLKGAIWTYAALVTGCVAGPVTFVAYARSSQLLGFRISRLLGVFVTSAAIALPLAMLLEKSWLFAKGPDAYTFTQLHLPIAVALIEEASKLLICYFFLRSKRQRFRMDAVVFGAAAGMGFAAVENMIYGWAFLGTGETGSMLAVLWLRALLSPFGHGTWTAIAAAGIGIGLSKASTTSGKLSVWLKVAGLVSASILLHTLWDFQFASGALRVVGMAAVGGAGLLLLFLLIRSGTVEEIQALTLLNPALSADRLIDDAGEEDADVERPLNCLVCDTQCPPKTRYCPRCGQSLRAEAARN